MPYKNISCIILAGGKSSRLGRDKCDEVYKGYTLLEWQIKKVEELGIEDIYISGYKGAKCNKKIIDDNICLGPMSGIYTCIDKIKNNKALVLSVDVPLVPINELEKLIERALKEDCPITVMSHNGKLEPLIAVYDKCIYKTLEAILNNKNDANYSMKHLMEAVGYIPYIAGAEDRDFININYESDLIDLISK